MVVNPKSLANLSAPFKAGETANPGGKPVNSRNAITKAFLTKLAKDFEDNGKAAIEETRVKHPDRYVAIVASLLPKEFIVERPLDGLSDDELALALSELRTLVSRLNETGGGTGEAGSREPSSQLPGLH